jgi:ubiquitin-conjugating enzyme (huntingtin interacting protein 2)
LVQGAICLDILGSGWSPVQTIKSALLSLRMLLEFPNARDPQDAEVAKLANDNPDEFLRTAHQWAIQYAGANEGPLDYAKMRKRMFEPANKTPTVEYAPLTFPG